MDRCSTFSLRIWIDISPQLQQVLEVARRLATIQSLGNDRGNVATLIQSIVAMETSGNLAMLTYLPVSRELLLNQHSPVFRPIHSREAHAINPNSLEHESGALFHALSHLQRRPAIPLRPIAPHLPIRIRQPHLTCSRRRLQTSCIRWRPSQRSTITTALSDPAYHPLRTPICPRRLHYQ